MTSLRISRDAGKGMKYGRLMTVMGAIAMAIIIFQQYTNSSRSENTTTRLARKVLELDGAVKTQEQEELQRLKKFYEENKDAKLVEAPPCNCPTCPARTVCPACAACPACTACATCPAANARALDIVLPADSNEASRLLLQENSKLKERVKDLDEAFQRVRSEKSILDSMMANKDPFEATLDTDAIKRASAMMAKCGQSAGKIITKPGVQVWKGYACEATEEELAQYLNYEPRGMCPDDWLFVQSLIYTKNCFALPKRRCTNRTPFKIVEPVPFPRSLFAQEALDEEAIRWSLHQCKSFACLNDRRVGDCRNCFNFTLEQKRWKSSFRGSLKMKEVIDMKKGSLRLGLDAGGGTGSFAAHMALYNCTVMTTAFNVETVYSRTGGLPYMEAIALRGLIPLHSPFKQRLPLYDNTLDIIHSVNSVKFLPMLEFEELIFDWDRVLRAGGLLWFEMFYASKEEMPLYMQTLDLLGYKRLYWKLTPKPDKSEFEGAHVYLNAILEKPARGDGNALAA